MKLAPLVGAVIRRSTAEETAVSIPMQTMEIGYASGMLDRSPMSGRQSVLTDIEDEQKILGDLEVIFDAHG